MANDRITHSVSHQLKLALAGQRLLYGVSDKTNHLLTFGEHYLPSGKELQTLFDRDEVLSGIYAKTQLLIICPRFVMAPERYARYDHNYELYKLSNKTMTEERLFRDHSIEQKEIQYSGNREFLRLIQNKFPNILRMHLSSFCQIQAQNIENELESLVQLFICDDYLYITASNDKDVLLSNAYHIVNNEELFYFTMLAAEQLKLDPRSTQLFLYQSNNKEQDLESLFKNYFQRVTMSKHVDKSPIEIWNACE